MEKISIKASTLVCLVLSFVMLSCKKDNITFENNLPEVPVTVSNLYGTFLAPTVSTSLSAGGIIKIEMEIPTSSGRTIKEISKVAIGTAYGALQVSSSLFKNTPIPGDGTKVVFTTTLAEYATFTKLPLPTASQAGTTVAAAMLARNFYFSIKLDDDQVIVPQYVRVYVEK